MCGIVGHVACQASQRSRQVVLDGLSRLEYRGYDSAGIALASPGKLNVIKAVGKLVNLREAVDQDAPADAFTGIGHTRWATHGRPTVANAHPHVSPDGRFALVHNGIIENADNLRAQLRAQGAVFASETDTEVVVHLLARAYDQADPASYTGEVAGVSGADEAVARRLVVAMREVTAKLEGTFTLLALSTESPKVLVAARRSSPLVIGLGEGENFLGSDVLAFIEHTNRAVEIGQDQLVVVSASAVTVIGADGHPVPLKEYEVDFSADRATKGGWPTFMEKEIHEQPAAVEQTLMGRLDENGNLTLDELNIDDSVLRSIDKIIVVACGTAAYAGQVARYAIEHWCRIPTEVELAHEFRYRDPIVNEKTLIVALSQSGETMDTLMAVRHAREQGAKVISICNTHGSTLPRESDAALYTHAGPEIAVASTKAFLAQITAAYLLGLYLAQLRGNKYKDEIASILAELQNMPAKIQKVIDNDTQVKELGVEMKDASSVIFLGRHVGFPVAMEGALKLKEITYIHAEGFAAGELKHGPIALIDEGQPVIVVVPSANGRDSLHGKVVSNIQEVRARGAFTIVIAEEGDEAVKPYADRLITVPACPSLLQPLLATVPLQIFACALAEAKGLDVDQPRNLAKSVTVE